MTCVCVGLLDDPLLCTVRQLLISPASSLLTDGCRLLDILYVVRLPELLHAINNTCVVTGCLLLEISREFASYSSTQNVQHLMSHTE